MNRSVKIGPHFFAKAKNDYSDWRYAIAREFIQNSIDAKSDIINVSISAANGKTTLTVRDDGVGMAEDTLCDKLLCLGESGKDFAGGSVGGFGKAKEILYFCHDSYNIKTNGIEVTGCGAEYVIAPCEFRRGVESTIVLDGDYSNELIRAFKGVISMTQWSGVFYVNDELLRGNLKKGAFRKELSWCKIYTNKSFINRLIVRIGGIVMFSKHVTCDRCVVVELQGSSGDVLQSSRDCLKYNYAVELDELIRQLTVDRHSAFRSDCVYYTRFEGEKLENRDKSKVPELLKIMEELRDMANAPPEPSAEEGDVVEVDATPSLAYISDAPTFETVGAGNRVAVAPAVAPISASVRSAAERLKLVSNLKHDFIIRNNAQMQIPDHFLPGSFSAYSQKLTRYWVNLLLQCYRTFGRVEQFSVGFCFEDEEDTWAMHQYNSEYGRVYYINPAKIVRTSTGVRTLAKRWGFTPSMKYHLTVTAVHEYVHGLGYSCHDESYVCKHDECLAIVMKDAKEFRACFA